VDEGKRLQTVIPFPQSQSRDGAEPAGETYAGSIIDLIADLKADGRAKGWAADRARRAAEVIEELTKSAAE